MLPFANLLGIPLVASLKVSIFCLSSFWNVVLFVFFFFSFLGTQVFQFTGNYEYVEVLMRDKKLNGGVPTRLIVDMDFRSQFEVARPTRAYKELIDALPSIFVGTEKKLKEIVSLLCPACRKSLKETGLHIPPWRSASYMQSKWLSTNCKKVTFSPNNELGVDQSEEKSTSTCCPFIF